MRNVDCGMQIADCGLRIADCGIRGIAHGAESEEFGSGTRRRPIGRDYAAAKDAEVGKKEKIGLLVFLISDQASHEVYAFGRDLNVTRPKFML